MKLINLFVIAAALTGCLSPNSEIAQWRGPNRDGIFPEKGLLKEWPENGPELLWSVNGLGAGHSSPVVAGKFVFVTGIPDTLNSEGFLFKFDLKGNLEWKKSYGRDWNTNFPGARSTPTIAGNLVYIESGNGSVHCLSADDGKELWSVDFFTGLQADSVQFGYSESVLIDGDRLICTPGGKVNNIVALNRFTGALLWSSKGFGEPASYSSPILADHNGRKLVINLTASSIIGVDGDSGEMKWRVHQFQDNKIHANTPVYFDGKVLVASASRKDSSGLVMLQLSPDGSMADIVWRNNEMINLMGGIILKDGYIYGSSYLQPRWFCFDVRTGETVYIAKDLGGGSIIWADGLFYCYAERDGEIALVEASNESFRVISKFTVPHGTAEHWAHPVIAGGLLLVRHGDSLMAYNIRK